MPSVAIELPHHRYEVSIEAGNLDRLGTDFVGVWIKYEHSWVTKIFADTSIITDASVIRLEPRER